MEPSINKMSYGCLEVYFCLADCSDIGVMATNLIFLNLKNILMSIRI